MRAHEKVANVDGASWIREQLQARPDLLRFDGLGLDFYHLSENVHRCRRLVFGLAQPEGESWANDILHSFKHAGLPGDLAETRAVAGRPAVFGETASCVCQ